jgi:hypothetical protein
VGCTVAAGSQGQARCAHRFADAARPWTALRLRAAWPLGLPAAQSVLFGRLLRLDSPRSEAQPPHLACSAFTHASGR